jgi:Putative prokaryotic signal transducing protein
MMITRQSLAEHFGRLNNDELVTEFQSGGLTELAREVAAAEIESRSIDISQYQARLPEPRPDPEMDSEDLVLLARFYDVSSAYLLQSRLDAEGLPSIVADALTYQNIIGGALGGGVRVLVPESYFARAAEIKSRIDSGTYTLDDNAG